MTNYNYDELVQMAQDGQITWCEFVQMSDSGVEFSAWCSARGLVESNRSAQAFVDMQEERLYDDSDDDHFFYHTTTI